MFIISSWNICADYFSKANKFLEWEKCRKVIVFAAIWECIPHVVCLQELSTRQCVDFYTEFSDAYDLFFLSQTPSELPLGEIAKNEQVLKWEGRDSGTGILAMMINKSMKIIIKEISRFWLHPAIDITKLPKDQVFNDRGKTDKGFGNMNTYRGVLWANLTFLNQDIFVFNSHYPLSGGSETRYKCAQLEKQQIHEITKGKGSWFSCGDRNFILKEEKGNEILKGNDYIFHEDSTYFYGTRTTWIGYDYDEWNIWKKGSECILDVCVSNLKPKTCSHLPFVFVNGDKKGNAFGDITKRKNHTASDHCMVLAEFEIKGDDNESKLIDFVPCSSTSLKADNDDKNEEDDSRLDFDLSFGKESIIQ